MKQFWLGPDYPKEGVAGNDMSRTNIPDIRIAFRYETFLEELSTLFHTAKIWTVIVRPDAVALINSPTDLCMLYCPNSLEFANNVFFC